MIEAEKILKDKDIKYRLIKLFGRVVNHESAKKYIKDADPENDCKTIITSDEQGNQYAFFLRGMMKIDFSKVKKLLGKKINVLSYEDLKKSTGKEPGEVCPFLLKDTQIYVDKKIFQRDKIHFGSGDSKYGLEIFAKDLKKIINFEIVDIAQENIRRKASEARKTKSED